jgi:hypothetical protein
MYDVLPSPDVLRLIAFGVVVFSFGWISGAAATKKFWYQPMFQRAKQRAYVVVDEAGDVTPVASEAIARNTAERHAGWRWGLLLVDRSN